METTHPCTKTKGSLIVNQDKAKIGKKGVAIVLVLMIILISSLMIGMVLYFSGKGTEISLIDKKYKTAKDASYGAVDFFLKDFIPTSISIATATPSSSIISSLNSLNLTTSTAISKIATDTCFSSKLLSSTSSWHGTCSASSDIKTSGDIKFSLKAESSTPFDVYIRITDTIQGNSNTGGVMLEGTGVAESSSGIITPQHFPYTYSIDVQGERQLSPSERVQFEVLYAY